VLLSDHEPHLVDQLLAVGPGDVLVGEEHHLFEAVLHQNLLEEHEQLEVRDEGAEVALAHLLHQLGLQLQEDRFVVAEQHHHVAGVRVQQDLVLIDLHVVQLDLDRLRVIQINTRILFVWDATHTIIFVFD